MNFPDIRSKTDCFFIGGNGLLVFAIQSIQTPYTKMGTCCDRIVFLGYRSQAEVAEELSQTDVFVLPSFAEGVPVVLMEAMAAQVPVLTTRIAGVPELVEDGVSGHLVSPGDVTAFASALDDLLSHPGKRKSFGVAGRAKVMAEYDAAQEAHWLSKVMCCYAEGGPSPALRPQKGTE